MRVLTVSFHEETSKEVSKIQQYWELNKLFTRKTLKRTIGCVKLTAKTAEVPPSPILSKRLALRGSAGMIRLSFLMLRKCIVVTGSEYPSSKRQTANRFRLHSGVSSSGESSDTRDEQEQENQMGTLFHYGVPFCTHLMLGLSLYTCTFQWYPISWLARMQ